MLTLDNLQELEPKDKVWEWLNRLAKTLRRPVTSREVAHWSGVETVKVASILQSFKIQGKVRPSHDHKGWVILTT